MFYSQAVVE